MEYLMVMEDSLCPTEITIKDKLNLVEQMGLGLIRLITRPTKEILKIMCDMEKAKKKDKGISSADSIFMEKRSQVFTNTMGMYIKATSLMDYLAEKGNWQQVKANIQAILKMEINMAMANLDGLMDPLIEGTTIKEFEKVMDSTLIVKIQVYLREYGKKVC